METDTKRHRARLLPSYAMDDNQQDPIAKLQAMALLPDQGFFCTIPVNVQSQCWASFFLSQLLLCCHSCTFVSTAGARGR